MIVLRSREEVDLIRAACRVVAEVLVRLREAVEPGISTWDLDRLAEEWTRLVKRLWVEDSVSHEGRFFTLTDCQSKPKPLSKPRPDLICAGVSERGFSFAVAEADACFIGGEDEAALRDQRHQEGLWHDMADQAVDRLAIGGLAIEGRAVGSVHGRAAFNICAVSCNGRPTTLL